MTNLEIIKQACVAANPDIMKLELGCEVKTHEDTKDEEVYTILRKHGNFWMCASLQKQDCGTSLHGENAGFRILGRPIRLADCVLAVEKKLMGKFKTISFAEASPILGITMMWAKATDSLTSQSEETLSFLATLLK